MELAGRTIGVTAERRRAELGGALERHGARVMYGQAIHLVALTDDARLREATQRCLDTPPDVVVATTAIGFRGWLEAAEAWGLATRLRDVLSGARIMTRGPKARGAVRAAGLREEWFPESESTAEVVAHLLDRAGGLRVAVQLHGEPLDELLEALRAAGDDVIEVPVYRWEPPADEAPLRQLIEAIAGATIDAVAFTSAPAAVNVLRTAEAMGCLTEVRAALRDAVVCAAVGTVTAAPLIRAGVPVLLPDRPRLGALVRVLVDRLGPAPTLPSLDHGTRREE